MRYLLICEGVCNPDLSAVTYALLEFRASSRGKHPSWMGATAMPPVPNALARRLRALRHTPHVWLAGQAYRCDRCNHVRRFGGSRVNLLATEPCRVTL